MLERRNSRYPVFRLWFWTVFLTLSSLNGMVYAQQVDIHSIREQFKNSQPVKVTGNISASAVGYTGDSQYGRDPFNYHFNGNLQVSLFQRINMPFSFNFTNAGTRYNYPTLPNRLSLHPTYKSVRGHIGDVSMTFSPYTLSAVQFRGAGVDIEPTSGPWRVSAMYGRLQRAVAYNPDQPFVMPTYKRIGYGTKVGYEATRFQVGGTVFIATDKENSLPLPPDSLGIVPSHNVALSANASFQINPKMKWSGEYGISILQRDIRDGNMEAADPLLGGVDQGAGTYHAWKTSLDYSFRRSVVGLGYERIAPGYQTLGAYYFNNDLENMTLNYMQPLFRDKVHLGLNLGLQRDDLDRKKASRTSRFVGAVNLNITPSDRLNATVNYSNFQTHVNIKPQFDYINAADPMFQADTLSFIQLSQNANTNISYVLSQRETLGQNLQLNLNYQVASDEQGGVVQRGSGSGFYSGMATYSLSMPQKSMQVSTSFNYTHNTIGRQDTRTLGPTVAVNKKFLSNTLSSSLSSSYNTSTGSASGQGISVFNVRMSLGYVLFKRHMLGLHVIHQQRSTPVLGRRQDLTATMSYNYAFVVDKFKVKLPAINFWKGKNKKERKQKEDPVEEVPDSPKEVQRDIVPREKQLPTGKEAVPVQETGQQQSAGTNPPAAAVQNSKPEAKKTEPSVATQSPVKEDLSTSPLAKALESDPAQVKKTTEPAKDNAAVTDPQAKAVQDSKPEAKKVTPVIPTKPVAEAQTGTPVARAKTAEAAQAAKTVESIDKPLAVDGTKTIETEKHSVESPPEVSILPAMRELRHIAQRYAADPKGRPEDLALELQKIHIDFGPNPYLGLNIFPENSTYYYVINVFDWRINMPPSRYGLGQFNRNRRRDRTINHYVKDVNQEHQFLYVGPFPARNDVLDYERHISPFITEIMKVPEDMYNLLIMTKDNLDKMENSIQLFHYYQYYLEQRARMHASDSATEEVRP
ncbi:brain acid soluble protein 1 [Sphingobacterium sp. xlx-130]|uniref:brain acid soluble protein 1 n=1 Tax=Sphingobacterium sp. xlx-130 TaxID=2654323 RepID=UPI0013DD479B|nr:brain acid soluble protein 1 [Sphingobacterium sp. xlx-130]